MDHETNKVKGSGHEGLVAGVQDVGGTHAVRDDSGSAVDGGSNRSRGESAIAAPVDLTPEVLARWEELAAGATDTMRDSGNDEPWGVYASTEGWEAESNLSFGPDNSNAVGVIYEGFALADFVAESITAVPALLSGVRSRDARIAELEAALERQAELQSETVKQLEGRVAARDAVIESARNELADDGEWTSRILSAAPSSVLAARDAEKWDEGFDAAENDIFEHERQQYANPCIPNPYRAGATNG